jgi:hypothetical protein
MLTLINGYAIIALVFVFLAVYVQTSFMDAINEDGRLIGVQGAYIGRALVVGLLWPAALLVVLVIVVVALGSMLSEKVFSTKPR